MIWTISTPVVQAVVEPQTVSVNISRGNNQLLILLLATRDGRDNFYNTATFNGSPMTTWGHQVRNDGASDIATIHGLYFNCAGLAAGNYNLFKECTTGGPDSAIESWFVITGNESKNPIQNMVGDTSLGKSGTVITNTINVDKNNMLILSACGSEPDSTPSVGAGQTSLVSSYSGGTFLGCSYKQNQALGSNQMYWTQTNDRWAQITMTIRAAMSGGGFLLNFV